MITGIKPMVTVRLAPVWLDTPEAELLIREAHVVFGCLDRDLPRLQITAICARYARPLFDLAIDVGAGGNLWYGGRVLLCDGTRCVACLGYWIRMIWLGTACRRSSVRRMTESTASRRRRWARRD